MGELKEFSIEKIYEFYRTQISDMISYIEVYEHDLPPLITGLISEMFSAIAMASILDKEDTDGLDVLIQNAAQAIRLHAIFVFINEIGEREKLFSNYQYKGAMIPETNTHIFDEVQKKKKAAIHDFTNKLKRYYRYSLKHMFSMVRDADSPYGIMDLFVFLRDYIKLYGCKRFSRWKEPFIPLDFLAIIEEDGDLSQDYNNFKELLLFCENHMSDVIITGPKVSFSSSLFVAVTSWIIPIAVGVPAVKYVMRGVIYLLNMLGL